MFDINAECNISFSGDNFIFIKNHENNKLPIEERELKVYQIKSFLTEFDQKNAN